MTERIPDQAIALLEDVEGKSNNVYDDVAGNPTIGVGHMLKPGEDYTTITDDQIAELLKADLQVAARAVYGYVTRDDLNDNQISALISFVFNIGSTGFSTSTVLKRVNDGADDQVRAAMLMWNHTGGAVSQGLINRRNKEADLYELPV